ncbi:hypothetical protein B0T17DRAFT_482566 [Bombardia bombarda]|uniref:DNA damage-responsive protein 48 n=1 Tax=Bombardia bombarda TaxID=252184 RepID=A0AA39XM76_9PEZI|nr:hypothetical protein B0T17DRAFT_482566 [Bombardia bombarda]
MDFINKLASQATGEQKTDGSQGQQTTQQQSSSSGGGFMDKLNGLAGGGKESEKNEDILDKGVDWVQENILKQGAQDNESAVEQAKDEKISDFIREQYKKNTGKEFPAGDKKTSTGF